MYPLLAVFIFSSISCFVCYLKKGNALILACSVLFTASATLQSEIGFILYPVLLVLLLNDTRPITKKALAFFPFMILLALYAGIFLLIRKDMTHTYSGVQTNLDPAKMLEVAFFQLVAAVPMTGYSYMSNIPGFFFLEFSNNYPVLIISIIIIVYIVKSSNVVLYQRLDVQTRRNIFGVGIVLFVLPACILMLSKKYQGELEFGRGYLPVYIQDFGFVLLMLTLFDFLFAKFQNRKRTVLTMGLGMAFLIAQLTFLRNNHLIDQMNFERATPSVFYYKSLKNGILNSCEKGSSIVFGSYYFYHTLEPYQTIVDNFYNTQLQVILKENYKGISKDEKRPYYLLEHDNIGQFTTLYRILPNGKKMIKRINYPAGDEFSYFDLISKPL